MAARAARGQKGVEQYRRAYHVPNRVVVPPTAPGAFVLVHQAGGRHAGQGMTGRPGSQLLVPSTPTGGTVTSGRRGSVGVGTGRPRPRRRGRTGRRRSLSGSTTSITSRALGGVAAGRQRARHVEHPEQSGGRTVDERRRPASTSPRGSGSSIGRRWTSAFEAQSAAVRYRYSSRSALAGAVPTA